MKWPARGAGTGKARPLAKRLGRRNAAPLRPANGPYRNNPYQPVYLYERTALPVQTMVLLAAAAAAAAIAAEPPSRAVAVPVAAEAVATVRIVRGVRLKLDSPTNEGAPPAHDSKVKTDGKPVHARLIEFE